MSRRPRRHVVLDNEAVRGLLSRAPVDRARTVVVEALAAADGRRIAPSAVRGEAGWRRADPRAADANRLVPDDDPLDRGGADRVVELRRAVPSASVVDAAVAVAAERVADDSSVVEILTSDVPDLVPLVEQVCGRVEVVRLG